MIILGIDPGLATTGWSIIKNNGKQELIAYNCILTSPKKQSSERLLEIYKAVGKIIKKYKPQVLCLEKLFFNTNVTTAFAVGEARGVIKICAFLHKIPLFEFTPLQVKSSIVGYGRAEKKQVQQMVKMLLHLKDIPKPDDAADAVAVALTYCFFNKKLQSLKSS
jgi:crossover junction endodeoxyribonuclease RuvC